MLYEKSNLSPLWFASFCYPGCACAYNFIYQLKLDKYYKYCQTIYGKKAIKLALDKPQLNYLEFVNEQSGFYNIDLLIEGIHCGACVWLIENTLQKQKNVIDARLNLSTHKLNIVWSSEKHYVNKIIKILIQIGYRAIPFSIDTFLSQNQIYQKNLLRYITVAAACSAQIMMISLSIWAGITYGKIEQNTASLLNILITLIAVPAASYSGLPFFRSAWNAIKSNRK